MHPSRDELMGLLLGTLLEESADQVTEHLEQCPACEETARELDSTSDDLIRTLRRPGVPHPMEQEAWCEQMLKSVVAMGAEGAGDPWNSREPPIDDPAPAMIRDYRLVARIGQGGMGVVYQAVHEKLGRTVAVKVLPAGRISRAAVARFEREMKAVGRLSHPNIVAAHDAGEHGGTHFLVMELVDGVDLSRLLRSLGALPISEACSLVREAANGLQHVHDHGLVHRDIKPSNLMLTKDGRLKILDLGLARLHDNLDGSMTSVEQMMGTIDYMAPEQIGDSHGVDIRADIYSLGASLFELLTGRTPFSKYRADTLIRKLNTVAMQPASSVSEFRAEAPEGLAAIVARTLAKDPAERYANPQELAEALQPYAAGADLATLAAKCQDADSRPAAESASATWSNADQAHDTSGGGEPRTDAADAIETPAPAATTSTGKNRLPKFAIGTVVAAALALVAGLYFSGLLFTVKTHDGTLVVRIDGGEFLASVEGQKVTVKNSQSGEMYTIHLDSSEQKTPLKPGNYFVLETSSGLRTETSHFTIAQGREQVVEVSWVPRDEAIAPDDPDEIAPGIAAAPPPAEAKTEEADEAEEIEQFREMLQAYVWTYRDSLYPPGDTVRFYPNGKFHDRWRWNYWVTGRRTLHVQFWEPVFDPGGGVVFTFNEEMTEFTSVFGKGREIHRVKGTRLNLIPGKTAPDRPAAPAPEAQ